MNGSPIIPTFRYRDARAAIEFLREAFGFEPRLVVPGEDDTIAHAQLTCGQAMVMLGTARDDAFGKLQQPVAPGAACTSSPYLVVEDVDAHCARARAAGAEVVMEPEDQDYGGRSYACRDPQGQLWSFGSYDPWAE